VRRPRRTNRGRRPTRLGESTDVRTGRPFHPQSSTPADSHSPAVVAQWGLVLRHCGSRQMSNETVIPNVGKAAAEVCRRLRDAGVFTLSLSGGPGACRTAVLEQMLRQLRRDFNVDVIVANPKAERNVRRLHAVADFGSPVPASGLIAIHVSRPTGPRQVFLAARRYRRSPATRLEADHPADGDVPRLAKPRRAFSRRSGEQP
jgi:hypothetical protein